MILREVFLGVYDRTEVVSLCGSWALEEAMGREVGRLRPRDGGEGEDVKRNGRVPC